MKLELEAVNAFNRERYRRFDAVYDQQLRQYQSRIRPDEQADRLAWYLIRVDGRDAGGIWLEKASGEEQAVLGVFLADPDCRGKGIGSWAIRTVLEQDLPRLGAAGAALRVRKGNARAIACYEKCGFVPAREYRKENGLEVIEMHWEAGDRK